MPSMSIAREDRTGVTSLVTQSNNTHPCRAYIENLLNFGQEAKNSQLSALLWHRNTSGHFNSCAAANKGYTQRKALAAESEEIDMMGKLHIDLTFQNRYLLNGRSKQSLTG